MCEFRGLSFANLVRKQVDQKINFGIETLRANAGPEALEKEDTPTLIWRKLNQQNPCSKEMKRDI